MPIGTVGRAAGAVGGESHVAVLIGGVDEK